MSALPTPQNPLPGTLTFARPLPGLGAHTEFTLCAVEGTDDLFTLTAATASGGHAPRLFLLDPAAYFLDYAPDLPAEIVADLAQGPTELVVLTVLHPADELLGPTVNLLAPVVLNPATRRAQQIVLDAERWPLRASLIPEAAH